MIHEEWRKDNLQAERMRTKRKRIENYNQYAFTWKDWVEFLQITLLKVITISYLFYDSYKACILFIPFAMMDYRNMKHQKMDARKRKLTLQFRDMIKAFIAALNAGYSLEKAVVDARNDLSLIYDEKEMIFLEMDEMISGLRMNRPLEVLLKDFGNRSGVEDIKNFANVVAVAKKSGGNLIHIIQKTVNCIGDKIAVEEEIKTMIAAKKLEQKIMMIMPYGILFYLRVTNENFLGVLYHNMLGIVLMTCFLIVIYIADLWAKKIMEISV